MVTLELHSGIPCSVALGSLLHLPYPSLLQCPPCSIPRHLLWPMPASVFRVPFPDCECQDVRGRTEPAEN
ncbi:unnamed protein product [Staurois parvus]|uniref:Uncharacterized protein n=1 Tax=Staurois parvus TaxID=386267 RepID=A0ABN9D0Q2_9NEOB|nr:unnamed protein product [Staurois parvus]